MWQVWGPGLQPHAGLPCVDKAPTHKSQEATPPCPHLPHGLQAVAPSARGPFVLSLWLVLGLISAPGTEEWPRLGAQSQEGSGGEERGNRYLGEGGGAGGAQILALVWGATGAPCRWSVLLGGSAGLRT